MLIIILLTTKPNIIVFKKNIAIKAPIRRYIYYLFVATLIPRQIRFLILIYKNITYTNHILTEYTR